jgi:hypothetical protein
MFRDWLEGGSSLSLYINNSYMFRDWLEGGSSLSLYINKATCSVIGWRVAQACLYILIKLHVP